MGPFETIVAGRDGDVVTLTLNQPATRNAMSLRMVAELRAALATAEAERARVVVLRGAGGHFCSGGDLKDMAAARMQPFGDGPDRSRDPIVAVSAAFGELCAAYARTGLATVAVLEGAVMGGGFGLACAVDLAVATTTAQLRLPEVTRGVVPAQIAPFLVERLGYSQAKRLAITGASLDGEGAYRLGLVHQVTSAEGLDAALAAIIADLLTAAPQAVAATKALMAQARHSSADQLVQHAAAIFAAAARGAEGTEGMTAFLQKRKPAWAPEKETP
jgi:isohexenylglutaconyl-CoA hydratase